ncbi:hypothetical protein [Photobacterium leiognathi]|uniref:hypothetical protein n=1 Tax=Photobacterium leiognathi TaxID=553611 RepID=UPI002980B41C|nr:hypothetical protein [Photobacterium leiognathi]
MTTLLITSLLLIVALLFSLASYKNLFYQIKRTQNEVLARQAHWAAEGGLECGFSAIKKHRDTPEVLSVFNECEKKLSLSEIYIDANDYVHSRYNSLAKAEIRKKIRKSPSLAGAIQARSDLKLIGDYDIYPDVESTDSNGKYKCVSIRYSKNFYYQTTVANDELEVFDPEENGPYDGFAKDAECVVKTHLKTNTSTENATKNNLKEDFVYDDKFDPFESALGVPRSELENLKKEFKEINGSKTECDKNIKDAFIETDKVWVKGHCDLMAGTEIASLNNTPRILVIENGIFATYGAVEFYGTLYHLYTDTISDMTSGWVGMSSGNTLNSDDKKKAVYYQSGSFVPVGGLILDAPGGLSVFTSSMSFHFKGEANPNKNSDFLWEKGSWHDF